jgi:hypothetical protein
MTLTRHTQVENLANLLAIRRRQAVARDRRDQAYRRLVATILGEPVDTLGTARLPTLLGRPVGPLPMRRVRAA